MALQRRAAICGTGCLHLRSAADRRGEMHDYDEAAAAKVSREKLLQDLQLCGPLLVLGSGDRLPPPPGLELHL